MKNCFILHCEDSPERTPPIAIADITNMGEMVPGTMTITRINVPATHRGKGYGSKLLKMVTDAADEAQVTLSLEIMPSGPLDYDQLYDWYCRHGFYTSPLIGIYIRHPEEKS